MNELSRWKAALKKHGIDSEEADISKGINDLPHIWVRPYNDVQVVSLTTWDDDDSAAEFRERIAKKVFGEWAHFAPEDTNDDDFYDGWALCVDDGVKGSGPTRLAALLSALEEKTND